MVDALPGDVEGGHHGVARELVDDPFAALDLLGRPSLQGGHPVGQLRGRGLTGEPRVTADVREQDRDHPFTGRDAGRRHRLCRHLGRLADLEAKSSCRLPSDSCGKCGRCGICHPCDLLQPLFRRVRIAASELRLGQGRADVPRLEQEAA